MSGYQRNWTYTSSVDWYYRTDLWKSVFDPPPTGSLRLGLLFLEAAWIQSNAFHCPLQFYFTIVNGCLLFSESILTWKSLQFRLLEHLRNGHLAPRIQAVAWFACCLYTGACIERCVKRCQDCSLASDMPTKVPLGMCSTSIRQWKRIHVGIPSPVYSTPFHRNSWH